MEQPKSKVRREPRGDWAVTPDDETLRDDVLFFLEYNLATASTLVWSTALWPELLLVFAISSDPAWRTAIWLIAFLLLNLALTGMLVCSAIKPILRDSGLISRLKVAGWTAAAAATVFVIVSVTGGARLAEAIVVSLVWASLVTPLLWKAVLPIAVWISLRSAAKPFSSLLRYSLHETMIDADSLPYADQTRPTSIMAAAAGLVPDRLLELFLLGFNVFMLRVLTGGQGRLGALEVIFVVGWPFLVAIHRAGRGSFGHPDYLKDEAAS